MEALHERNFQRRLEREYYATPTVPPLTGKLISPLLCSLAYCTPSQRGITNSQGEFKYLPGERVTFAIGTITLPAATTGPTVTPYDMGSSRNEPVNVARLLQSLPIESNGTLPLPLFAKRTGLLPINFAMEPGAFGQQPAVAKIIDHSGGKLLDAQTAVEQLDTMIACYIQRAVWG